MTYKPFGAGFQRFGLCALAWLWSVRCALADTDDDDDNDYDPLPGRSTEQIEALIFNFDEVVETVILYTALFALLVILLCLAASMRMRRWVGYTVLCMASLAWFALYEQVPTGLYWIGVSPPLSTLAVGGVPLIAAHFLVAGWSYPPGRRWPWMRPLLFAMAAGPVLALVLSWPVEDTRLPLLLVVLGLIGVASHLLSVPRPDGGSSRTLYTRRNVAVVVGGLAFTALVVFGEIDEGLDVSYGIRSLFVLVVLLFAFFLVQSVILILRDRDASQRAALDIAQREAEQAKALLEAEKNYARAKEVARLHTQRLANASHDIRQPITSLRATMAAVAKDQPESVQTQLRAAFDYLDQLARSYMETEAAPNAPDPVPDEVETFSSRMICDTLDRMFRQEAEGKGLAFRTEVTDQQLSVSPLVLTRVLSNLLSNAIQHTAEGHVTLLARDVPEGFEFAVQNSGVMPTARVFERGEKGEASGGSGYGLSIIQDLTEANGLTLAWSSTAAEGTTFRVGLPTVG